jgi:hypothetical protein
MGYIDDYKMRYGKCEYCKYNTSIGSQRCVECYGYSFEDSVDLYTFIRAKVSKDAIHKFNESDEGKHLSDLMAQNEQLYYQSKDAYNRARDKFVDDELKRIEDSINSVC